MKTEKRRLLYVIGAAFFATMAVYLLIQAVSGLYPFGQTLNLLWDEDIQYVDYFAFYRDVLLGEASIGYSFSKSLGGSLVALFGYYLGSPLNLLVVFFDYEQLPMFVFLITMLKMGLSGAAAAVFMKKRFPDLWSPTVVGLAMGYGLSQYMMLQCSNIMWLDGTYLLPLLLLSVYRFVKEKRKAGLFLMVLISIAVNWYTGYMTGLFAVCYFLYERILLVARWSKEECRRFFIDGIQCAAVMVLGVLGSSFIFFPVFKGLMNGKQAWDPSIFTYWEYYGSFFDAFRGFAEGNIAGTVSLYCGVIFFIFFLYYFISRQVKAREKILSAVAVLFMFACSWAVPLDCIWSGLRMAGSYRFRYSFVTVFLVLYLAAKGILAFQNLESEKKHQKIGLVFLGVVFVFLLSHFYRNYEIKSFTATLCTLILYMLLYFLLRSRKIRLGAVSVLLAAELAANGVITFSNNYGGWHPQIGDYQKYAAEAKEQAELVEDYDDSAFYRMETVAKRYGDESMCSAYLNDSMAYGYAGIAHYSSTFDAPISDMIHDLGYSSEYDLSIYSQPILSSDALLGIKYVLSKNPLTGFERVEELGTVNEKDVYRNPYALGLGMGAAETVFDDLEYENPFAYQNQLFSNILGRKVELFKEVEAETLVANQMLSFHFPAQDGEKQLYGYIDSEIRELSLYIDGNYRSEYARWLSYHVFDVGTMESERFVDLANYWGEEEDMRAYFYYLDLPVFEQVMEELGADAFDTKTFDDGYVAGAYTAREAGFLLLTIPYDEGWRAQVNGQEVKCRRGADALTVIPVEEGVNQIVLAYRVPGLGAGIMASCAAFLLMGLWCGYGRRRAAKSLEKK